MRLLALLILSFNCMAADTEWRGIVLLQPEVSIRDKNPDIQGVSDYIKAAQIAVGDRLKPAALPRSSGFVVFAVRKGGLSNAWLDVSPALPVELEQDIIVELRKIKPFRVDSGTLVFATRVSINGGSGPNAPMPFPAAWRKATEGSDEPVEVEALVERLWP